MSDWCKILNNHSDFLNSTGKYFAGIFIILLAGNFNAAAQSLGSLFIDNSGLQMGLFRGQTELDDSGLNYSFRLYSQQVFDSHRFGELSISSGSLSGLGYRSQLTPIEYRFGYRLSQFGMQEPKLFGIKSSVYAFAGLGILYNRPLEILAPDDPLTVEMGNSLPTSSFWDFNGGIAPFIPIGTGIEIPLEQNVWLNLNIGYNQSVSALKFNSHDVPGGYWNVSIGLRFKRSSPPVREPFQPAPIKKFKHQPIPLVEQTPVEVEPTDLSNMMLDFLNREKINFDILSSTPNEQGVERINEIAQILNLYPTETLQVFGHADSVGTETVNLMISESRARAIWLALVDAGVEPSRLGYNWYSDDRPAESNATSEGRFQNRRVEFKTVSAGMQQVKQPREGEIYRASIFADIEYGQPLLESRDLDFNRSMLGLEDYSQMLLQLIAYLMHSEQEINLIVLTEVGSGAGADLRKSLSKARAELIRAELILKGIDAKRVQAAIPGSELYKMFEYHLKGTSQQNILIPVNRESGNGLGEGNE